jgi:hypothetical protein
MGLHDSVSPVSPCTSFSRKADGAAGASNDGGTVIIARLMPSVTLRSCGVGSGRLFHACASPLLVPQPLLFRVLFAEA